MKYLILSISLIFAACGIFEMDDSQKYLTTVENNDVVLTITKGTLATPPQLKIFNRTDQIIYLHQQFIAGCSVANYSIKLKTNSGWADLKYNEEKSCWEIGGINLVCTRYFPPVELNPQSTYSESVLPVLMPGSFKLFIFYSYAEYTEAADWHKLEISCAVE
jgi:hypothetical protein